jgi:putative endonuclease
VLGRVAPGLALRVLSPRDPAFARAGERLAERALRRRGWRLLARRLRTFHGELDLVFAQGATLVVVEVKTGRAGPRFRPGMRLSAATLAGLWRAARHLARGAPERVDLVEVQLDRARSVRIVHHEGLRRPL